MADKTPFDSLDLSKSHPLDRLVYDAALASFRREHGLRGLNFGYSDEKSTLGVTGRCNNNNVVELYRLEGSGYVMCSLAGFLSGSDERDLTRPFLVPGFREYIKYLETAYKRVLSSDEVRDKLVPDITSRAGLHTNRHFSSLILLMGLVRDPDRALDSRLRSFEEIAFGLGQEIIRTRHTMTDQEIEDQEHEAFMGMQSRLNYPY